MCKLMGNIILTFLFSLLAFYAVDINTIIYLFAAAGIWAFLLVQYSYRNNYELYRKAEMIFVTNFLTFLLLKYVSGYRPIFDAEDRVCIVYGFLLCLNGCVLYYKKKRESPAEKKTKKILFTERRFDRDRLREYLPVFPIIGINGPWGSGKSFLVDHLEAREYIVVKIDLLTCNLDEIQVVLLNELDKVLKEQGIFSAFSPKLKKILKQGGLIQNVGQLLVRDDISYSEAIAGFRKDIAKLKQKIIIVYEDLDRIDKPDIVRKILGISEKIAGGNIRIIYQYDEENLQLKPEFKEFDRKYLEKYIPFIINLTDIEFSKILSYLFDERADRKLPVQRKDFRFLELPVSAPYSLARNAGSIQSSLQILDVTIRKTEYFLDEIILFMGKDGIYRENKRETILFFLIKHFYHDIYRKLTPGCSLLDIFTFSYEGRTDTIVNWLRYCKQKDIQINIADVFLSEENKQSALMISLFQYQCDIYEVERELEEIVNESVKNIERKNINEQKDRIVWNLLCNGKSEYTDQKIVIDRLQKEVLTKPLEQQKEAFEKLYDDIFHGQCTENEKGDNKTIFRFAVPGMVSLFQANRVAGITGEQWIAFIRFYFKYKDINHITPGLIEGLNYCELNERRTYLYILEEYNNLEVKGNLNSHKSYRTFLNNYLSALSGLGYINTEEVWYMRNTDAKAGLDASSVTTYVFEPLETKLLKLKQMIVIPRITDEIALLLQFIEKNKELMKAEKEFERPETKFKTSTESRMKNQETMDSLNELKMDDREFAEKVWDYYERGEITAYEITKLDRYKERGNEK